MTEDRVPTPTRSGEALERLMAVIAERTTIEPRHRPAIRASLRAYRRAIEAEASAAGWNRANDAARVAASEQPAPPLDWDRVNAILDDHAVPSTPAEWDSLRRALVEAERLGSGDD